MKVINILLYLKLLSVSFIFILTVTPSESYIKNNEIDNRRLTNVIDLSKKHDLFIPTIYKNNYQYAQNVNNSAILSNQSIVYTNLIAIDVHYIQQPFQLNEFDSGRFIEKLIYANLKIKQLIEYRNQLSNKSKILISKSTSQPFDKIIHYRQLKNNPIISNQLQKINYEFNQLASGMQYFDNGVETLRPLPNIEEIKNTHKINNDFRSSYTKSNISKDFYSKKPSSKKTDKDISELMDKGLFDKKSQYTKNQKIGNQLKKKEFPWFIKVLISPFNYFTENKIESLLFIGIIVFFVSIFAKRRN